VFAEEVEVRLAAFSISPLQPEEVQQVVWLIILYQPRKLPLRVMKYYLVAGLLGCLL
jgi:hypothetical protein